MAEEIPRIKQTTQIAYKYIFKNPIDIMTLKDIQEKTGIFQPSNDALCFGLKPEELDYLRTINVEPVQIESMKDAKERI
jgi:hypothetical protein